MMPKEKVTRLMWLCALAYFMSYVSRINLGAVLVEVAASGFAPKRVAALAITVCSATYGAGQIISGYLSDKFKPQNVMFAGFLITGTVNLAVSFLKNPLFLVPLWAINGFAQSLMWPPIVAILTAKLTHVDYQRSAMLVSWGGSFGTMAVYLFAPIIIGLSDVRYVFLTSAVLALLMGIFWKLQFLAHYESLENTKTEKTSESHEPTAKINRFVVLIIGIVMLAIAFQGALRDGISNWMPTYISEIFNMGSSVSILSGVILPIFSVVCVFIATQIYRRKIKNALLLSGIFFAISMLTSLLLAACKDMSFIISLLLLALNFGAIHGVCTLLTSMILPYFRKYGHVSLISGILNSCTYVGSSIFTYGIAVFSDMFGWSATVIMWAVIGALGAALCFGFTKKWSLFTK